MVQRFFCFVLNGSDLRVLYCSPVPLSLIVMLRGWMFQRSSPFFFWQTYGSINTLARRWVRYGLSGANIYGRIIIFHIVHHICLFLSSTQSSCWLCSAVLSQSTAIQTATVVNVVPLLHFSWHFFPSTHMCVFPISYQHKHISLSMIVYTLNPFHNCRFIFCNFFVNSLPTDVVNAFCRARTMKGNRWEYQIDFNWMDGKYMGGTNDSLESVEQKNKKKW